MSVLTANAFEQLLVRLDANPAQAAEKYGILRQKLVKCLVWKGCPETETDALADTALDRVAAKIAQGEQILNLNAYARTVLEYVWKEHARRYREEAVGDEKMPEKSVEIDEDEMFRETDLRLRCLRKCLAESVSDERDRMLIVGYYDAEAGDKLKDIRRNLAEKQGLTMTALKVKACRLRERLEKCINECAARLSRVTEAAVSDTTKQGR